MGVFDNLFKKELKKEIREIERNSLNLNPLHSELKKHQERLDKLHEYSQNLHRYAYYIEHSNTKHKKEIIEQINNITKWLEYLNENQNNLKKEFHEFKFNIKTRLKEDLSYYHELIEEYLTFKIEKLEKTIQEQKSIIEKISEDKSNKIDIEKLKESIITELKESMIKENRNDLEKLNQKTKIENELTNSEKQILSLLFNEGKPMTYEQISEKLNKPVNSIRVYMNSLKMKKPIVEEYLTSAGSKVFSIKNSEMVKTLFNTY